MTHLAVAPASSPRVASANAQRQQIGGCWLPTGDPEVARYFFRHLYPAHGLRRRLRATALHSAPPWCLQSAWTDGSETSEMPPVCPPETLDALMERAGEVISAPQLAEARRYILMPGREAPDRQIALLFGHLGGRPVAVLKIAPRDSPSLDHERQVIERLRRTLDTELAATLPEPLGLLGHREVSALLLSHVGGSPFYIDALATWRPGHLAWRHLESAAHWLGRFHRSTRSSQTALASVELAQLHEPMVEAHRAVFRNARGAPSWLEELQLLEHRSPLPAPSVHGDFWSRNLLAAVAPEDSLPAVVDWTSYQEVGDLSRDLFHLPLTYGLQFRWRHGRTVPAGEAFRRTFLENNRLARVVRRYLLLYCRVLDLDPTLLQPLFMLYLLQRAARPRPNDRTHLAGSGLTSAHWCEAYRQMSHADRSVFSS